MVTNVHVVTRPPDPFEAAGAPLRVHCVPAAHDNLVWLLEARDHTAAAVDGPDASILEYCARNGLTLTTVLTTHTHGDHIGLHRSLEAMDRLAGLQIVGCPAARERIPGLNLPVDEGAKVDFGGVEFAVLRTDGHLDGHVCYTAADLLFCGDTLFGAGCGRAFDGPVATLARSLRRLGELPPATRVCCAHEYTLDNLRFARWVDPNNAALRARYDRDAAVRATGGCTLPSTIGDERATNPYLRTEEAAIAARLRELVPGVAVDTPDEVFAALRVLKDTGRHRG